MTGDTLNNGAVEMLRKPTNNPNIDIVLAVFGSQFVTWTHNKKNQIFAIGNYFGTDLQEAMNDFHERT